MKRLMMTIASIGALFVAFQILIRVVLVVVPALLFTGFLIWYANFLLSHGVGVREFATIGISEGTLRLLAYTAAALALLSCLTFRLRR